MSKKNRKKHIKNKYRATKINLLALEKLEERVQGKKIAIGIDVAKKDMVATFMNEEQEIVETIKWKHPQQSEAFVGLLLKLPITELEVAMEPTGTYGDALRYQLLNKNISVYRVSAKRAHDASEVYDGVPSSHDAKSGAIIAKLHLDGMSEPWSYDEEDRRNLGAAIRMMTHYDRQYFYNINLLEGLLARHWPELLDILELTAVTLSTILSTYGGPAKVSKRKQEARKLMRKTGGRFLAQEKIDRIIESSDTTIGVPMFELEIEALKVLSTETLKLHALRKEALKKVEQLTEHIGSVKNMSRVVGKASAAVIVCKLGDPLNYDSSKAFEKSAGLNLKERSSGKHQGQLKITKRGSGTARQYIYLAALRLIKNDPVVRIWYAKKVERDGGKLKLKGIVAIMRKLTRALWHIARGPEFDSRKLFDVNRLSITETM